MAVIVMVLILASLLQTALWELDLVLLILIARTFIVDDKTNFWLAFGVGIFVAVLSGLPLGSVSLIYLFTIMIVKNIRKAQFAANPAVVLLASFVLIAMTQLVENIFWDHTWNVKFIITQTVLILPVYFALMFWEERFIPRKDIKLKVEK